MKQKIRQPGTPVQQAKRPFTWSIRSSEVPFMEAGAWEAPMEGCNCGPLVITPQSREHSATPPKQ